MPDARAAGGSLSEHFTVDELIESQTAARLGLDNTPPEDVVANLRLLCETILEPARQALGPLRISSGYRAPIVDDAIPRTAPNVRPSAHRFGYAADVIPLQARKLDFARWVYDKVPVNQIILEFGTAEEPAWVHVSAAPPGHVSAAPPGARVLRILAGTGYEPVTL